MPPRNTKLYLDTVSPLLMSILTTLMEEPLFDPFVLVGGTNLSLRLGHRISQDIDLFTDAEYGSLDFNALEDYLKNRFPYYERTDISDIVGFGRTYYVGFSEDDCIKLDLMYADEPFFEQYENRHGIRMATMDQIAAMKMEAINHGGRKKDWWDIHELLNHYSLNELLALHKRWEPWVHKRNKLLDALADFDEANGQPDPKCLKEKNWDEIKVDIIEEVNGCRKRDSGHNLP